MLAQTTPTSNPSLRFVMCAQELTLYFLPLGVKWESPLRSCVGKSLLCSEWGCGAGEALILTSENPSSQFPVGHTRHTTRCRHIQDDRPTSRTKSLFACRKAADRSVILIRNLTNPQEWSTIKVNWSACNQTCITTC